MERVAAVEALAVMLGILVVWEHLVWALTRAVLWMFVQALEYFEQIFRKMA